MDEQATLETYEPPALVEVGKFAEETLGSPGYPVPDGLVPFNFY